MFKPFKFRSSDGEEYTININQITHIVPDSRGSVITLSCGTKLDCGLPIHLLLEELNQKLS